MSHCCSLISINPSDQEEKKKAFRIVSLLLQLGEKNRAKKEEEKEEVEVEEEEEEELLRP